MAKVAPNWWANFYTGLWVDVALSREVDPSHTQTEATFVEAALQLSPGAQVLDLACGGGRHSLELAARGYHMTGVDITLPFLEKGRREAVQRALCVNWEQRDMRELPWQDEFDGAFCFGGSFGYFDDVGNAQVLRAVCRALKPGARFFLDTHILETVLPVFQEQDASQNGDTRLTQKRRYSHVRGRIETEWTLVHGGEVTVRLSSMRLYSYRELSRLLVEAGFGELTAYGSLAQDPFRLGSPRLYMVAAKA